MSAFKRESPVPCSSTRVVGRTVVSDEGVLIASCLDEQRAEFVNAAINARTANLDVVISQRDELLSQVNEWACDGCNTVYPGPPQQGFACVVCPKCGGRTMPYQWLKTIRAERQRDELLAALKAVYAAYGNNEIDMNNLCAGQALLRARRAIAKVESQHDQ